MSETPTQTPTDGSARPRPAPNYAARRMLVTTVAIVAIVAFGVVGWKVVRGDDESFGGSGVSWDEIVLVDRASGDVTILDDEGALDRSIVGRGRVLEVHTVGDRIALVGPTQIVIEGGDETVTVPIGRSDTVTPIRTEDGLDLIVGNPRGGNVQIVDVTSGQVLDVTALAVAARQVVGDPLMFTETIRWSADAEAFAIADASNFQTLVVRKDSEEVAAFRAQPIALDKDRVVTSQVIGGQAEVELYDYDRESKARVPTPIPAGGFMIDGRLLMVTIDGGVYSAGDGDSEAERLAQIAVPSGGTVDSIRQVFGGERLVVNGSAFEAVVDLEGRTMFTTTFTTAVDPEAPSPEWTCVPIGGGDTFHSIVGLEEGEQLADLSGVVVTGTAADGCTVIGERSGVTEVIGPDGTTVLGSVRSAVLGPDGRSVVRTTASGATQLVRIDDDLMLGDPVDLSDVAPTNALVAFLD